MVFAHISTTRMIGKYMAPAHHRPSVTFNNVCRRSWTHDVHSWMQSNRLQVDTNKTELLWCAMLLLVDSVNCRSLHAALGPRCQSSVDDGAWPGNLHRRRPQHVVCVSRSADCRSLLSRLASTNHLAFCQTWSLNEYVMLCYVMLVSDDQFHRLFFRLLAVQIFFCESRYEMCICHLFQWTWSGPLTFWAPVLRAVWGGDTYVTK